MTCGRRRGLPGERRCCSGAPLGCNGAHRRPSVLALKLRRSVVAALELHRVAMELIHEQLQVMLRRQVRRWSERCAAMERHLGRHCWDGAWQHRAVLPWSFNEASLDRGAVTELCCTVQCCPGALPGGWLSVLPWNCNGSSAMDWCRAAEATDSNSIALRLWSFLSNQTAAQSLIQRRERRFTIGSCHPDDA